MPKRLPNSEAAGRSAVDEASDVGSKASAVGAQLKQLAAADKQAKNPADLQVANALRAVDEIKKLVEQTKQESAAMSKQIASANGQRHAKQTQLSTVKAGYEAETGKFGRTFDALTAWVQAHLAQPIVTVPGNITPPSSLTGASLRVPLPAGTVVMKPKDISASFAGYPFELLKDKNAVVVRALNAIDPAFIDNMTGPAQQNTAFRLPDNRGLLILSGCETEHACDTTSFVAIFDSKTRRAGIVSQTATPDQYVLRGTMDAPMQAVLLNAAGKALLQ